MPTPTSMMSKRKCKHNGGYTEGYICRMCKKPIYTKKQAEEIDRLRSSPPAKGEEWVVEFEKKYYPGYFCDLNECDMTAIHIPIIQDDTGGKRVVGEIVKEKQCQCGGEIKRQELKSFIHSLLSQAYEEGRREAVEEVEQLRTQLAGCGVAALGGTKDPVKRRDWGWSQSYQDVLDLRRQFDVLKRKGKV